jgi:DNA-binding XRE family transcriptional regulator
MTAKNRNFRALVRSIRRQLDMSQEDLARAIGVSLATLNRWENGQVMPSKLARAQFEAFCSRMVDQGRLQLPGDAKRLGDHAGNE